MRDQADQDFKGRAVSMLEDDRRYALVMVLVSVVVLVFTAVMDKWADLDNYYAHAGDLLDGRLPYSGFRFEYPPLALALMTVPRLFSWDLGSYHIACAALAYVFLFVAAAVLDRFSDDMVGSRWQSRLVLLLTVVFSSYLLITRNDIFPAVLSLIAVRLFQTGRPVPAAAVVAVAAMVKLYPAIILVPMLGLLLYRRDWRSLCLSTAAAALVVLVVELPFIVADPSTAFDYLTYHSDRGVQVESLAGGLFLVAGAFLDTDLAVVFGYGSDNVVGVLPDAVAPYMNAVLFAVLAVFVLVVALRIARSRMDLRRQTAVLGVLSLTMVMLFIAFSKVYSAQYLIWVMMLFPLTQAAALDRDCRRRVFRVMVSFGVFSMLSYYAYACFSIYEPHPLIVAMIFMKNLFHVVLTVELLRMCWHETAPAGPGTASPAVRRRRMRCSEDGKRGTAGSCSHPPPSWRHCTSCSPSATPSTTWWCSSTIRSASTRASCPIGISTTSIPPSPGHSSSRRGWSPTTYMCTAPCTPRSSRC